MSRHLLIILGICALTFLTGLGRPALTDSDEAFYAESAREMIERGDFLTPYYNGEPRFEKPVLYYWLVALTYSIAGTTVESARFPSALAGFGLALLAFFCARRWYDELTGCLAGVICATSFGYIAIAHQALPDLPLAFFVSLTTWSLLQGLRTDGFKLTTRPSTTRWLLIAAVGFSAGILVKGPIALALPIAVLVPIIAFEEWNRTSRWRISGRAIWLSLLCFILIAAPWYIGMFVEHGPTYLNRFFISENLERFSTARFNEPRPFWYYLPIIFAGMLPWSPLLLLCIPSILQSFRKHRAPLAEIRLLFWIAAPLLFYSMSIGKQPRYILPVLPPIAILLAAALRRSWQIDTVRSPLFLVATLLTGSGFSIFGVLLFQARTLVIEWPEQWISIIAATVFLFGVVIAAISLAEYSSLYSRIIRTRLLPVTAIIVATISMSIATYCVLLTSPNQEPVERIAAILNQERVNLEPYGRYGVFNRNLNFYVHSPYVELPTLDAVRDFLKSPERVLCVIPAEDADRLEDEGVQFERIGEVDYVNTGNLNFRTLIQADSNLHIQHTVLLSNRDISP